MNRPPETLEVRVAPGTLVLERGRVLVGGTPGRLLRLDARARYVIDRWRTGGVVGSDPSTRALARRLLDAGLLVPAGPPDPGAAMDVVVPVYERPQALERCLAALQRSTPSAVITIVDDGSPDPESIQQVAVAHGARVVRHNQRRGPAAARNHGAAATERPLIAFIDSDIEIEPGCLARLAGTFADPRTAAAAPRVRSLKDGTTAIGRYQEEHSSLDMGRRPSAVRPGSPVGYVPTATLVVRRSAFGEGFDEQIQIGEDVDFVWRLCAAGWNVWYDPAATVRHEHRHRPAQFVRRRFEYAASIGTLAGRHPDALPALHTDAITALVALAVLGRSRTAAGLSAMDVLIRTRRLRRYTGQPLRLAVRVSARSGVCACRNLSRAVRHAWWPLLAPLARRRPAVRRALGLAWAVRLAETRSANPADLVLAIAEDLTATAGTWWSCIRCRVVTPLLPSQPRRGAR